MKRKIVLVLIFTISLSSLIFSYEIISNFGNGLHKVLLGDKLGLVDENGNIVLPIIYDSITKGDYSEGELESIKLEGKWGFINKDGIVVISPIYDNFCYFHDGYAAVKLNNKYGFIDETGREVVPFIYDDAWGFEEGYALIKLNNKWGFIDKNLKVVVKPIYDSILYVPNDARTNPYASNKKYLAGATLNGVHGAIIRKDYSFIPNSKINDLSWEKTDF